MHKYIIHTHKIHTCIHTHTHTFWYHPQSTLSTHPPPVSPSIRLSTVPVCSPWPPHPLPYILHPVAFMMNVSTNSVDTQTVCEYSNKCTVWSAQFYGRHGCHNKHPVSCCAADMADMDVTINIQCHFVLPIWQTWMSQQTSSAILCCRCATAVSTHSRHSQPIPINFSETGNKLVSLWVSDRGWTAIPWCKCLNIPLGNGTRGERLVFPSLLG
jgi:hypothetical protein